MRRDQVVAAWDRADPAAIHPARGVSEAAYWASGEAQAAQLATVLAPACTVLDFGCGDGRVTVPLHRRGYQVTAVDSSATMLARLARTTRWMTGPTTVQSGGRGLADQLPSQVDAVVCLAVLIHHDWATGAQLIGNLRRCVRPGGLLVLDWPVADRPEERTHWIGVTTWSRERQDALAAELGMARVERGLPWPTFVAV